MASARARTLVSLALALGCIALAPLHAPAADPPYTGVVVEESVQVRSGAGLPYYVVGEASRGQIVEVADVVYEWFQIEPPEGVYCYISRAYVDARGDGSRGRVNRDRAEIRTANISGPGVSYRIPRTLSEGDQVRIVGEAGDFYRIEPPERVYVFLPPQSVQPADEFDQQPAEEPEPAEAEEPDPEPREQEQQAEAPREDEDEPEPDDAEEEQPRTDAEQGEAEPEPVEPPEAPAELAEELAPIEPAEPDDPQAVAEMEELEVETPAVSERLRELERRHLPAMHLPVDEQPIEQMIEDYRRMQEASDLPARDRQIIEFRLSQLEWNQRRAATLERLAELRQRTERAEEERAEREAPRRTRRDYDAVGRLVASGVYDGQALPRMFRLTDLASGRTIAYVEPDETHNVADHLGEIVGIVGQRRLDPATNLRVFDLEAIDRLPE